MKIPEPIIVTRGGYDITDAGMPLVHAFGGVHVWDNSRRAFDLKLLAAYFAADESPAKLIFYQDDDLAISDPWEIVKAWEPGKIVCNMPSEFQAAYRDKPDCLMGFGSCFEKSLIRPTWERYRNHFPIDSVTLREAHRIFTGLNRDRIVMVDVHKTNLPYATDETRLWKQADHGSFAARAYERIRLILEKEGK